MTRRLGAVLVLLVAFLAGCNEKPTTVSVQAPTTTEMATTTTSSTSTSSTTTSSTSTSTTSASTTSTTVARTAIVTAPPATQAPVSRAPAVTSPAVPPTSCPNGTYVNSAGNDVCRPAPVAGPPAGATAQCQDGDYSFSQHRSGTCSGHGGVARWL